MQFNLNNNDELKNAIQYLTTVSDRIKNLTASSPEAEERIIKPAVSDLHRTKQEIKSWRTALACAERSTNSSYVELQRLYQEVDLDSEVTSCKTIRNNYILSREFQLLKGETIDKRSEILFNQNWFNKFLKYTLDAIYWGYSTVKIGKIDNDIISDVDLIQRQNVNPKERKILESPYSKEGVLLDEKELKDWYILISSSKDSHYTGLYSKIAPYQLQLKVSQIAFTDYCRRFGTPTAVVKTMMSNEKHLRNVEAYLQTFQNASYGIFNLNDEIQLLESSGKSSDIYNKAIAEHKSNIAKLILGSDVMHQEKSFVGSAEIAENTANIYSLSDIRFVEGVINNQLIPRLINIGFKFLQGVKFKFDTTSKADPDREFEMVLELLKTGKYNVPAEWIQEKFNIPVEKFEAPAPIAPEKNEEDEE